MEGILKRMLSKRVSRRLIRQQFIDIFRHVAGMTVNQYMGFFQPPEPRQADHMKPIHLLIITFALVFTSAATRVTADTPAANLPSGVIVMWSGTLDAIPDGWALCDGSNGTPDLRNRFVMGVGAAEYTGSTGGAHSHRHQTREHDHLVDIPPVRMHLLNGYSGYGYGSRGTLRRYYMFPEQTHDVRPFRSGTSRTTQDSVSNLPPFYKLAFIMKQ